MNCPSLRRKALSEREEPGVFSPGLTKTYNTLAAMTLRFFKPGLVVTVLYFAMSHPLSRIARKLEAKLRGDKVSS